MAQPPETHFRHDREDLSVAKGRRRALLITIDYLGTEFSIPSHTHLSGIKNLTMSYGYMEENIHVLSDDGIHTTPTRANILEALNNLVKDAKPGDRFFFYYCGHGAQITNMDGRETDGKDELILPLDYNDTYRYGARKDSYSVERYQNHILDDILNDILVKKLPVDSQLVALFDCCNAGTMMDLEYYLEDEPRYTQGPLFEAPIFEDIDVRENAKQKFTDSIFGSTTRCFESGGQLNLSHAQTGRGLTKGEPAFRRESFDPMTDASPKAHVVSWSSSLDGQQSWQHPKTGGVMSQAFIESLEDKQPTYEELFLKLSERLKSASQQITNDTGQRIQQKPMIGFHTPPDMQNVFSL